MPADPFKLKQYDRNKTLDRQLLNADGTAVDLSTADAVYFVMRQKGNSTTTVNAVAAVVGDPTLGNVRYSWAASDVDEAGEFEAEFRVDFNNGTTLRFPNDGHMKVTITPALAPNP